MIADTVENSNWNYQLIRIHAESRCSDVYLHGCVRVKGYVCWVGLGKAHATYFVGSDFPYRRRRKFDLFNNATIMNYLADTTHQHRHMPSRNSVFVGVREAVNDKKRVESRISLSMERLEIPNAINADTDTREWPLRVRETRVSDVLLVERSGEINRKLMFHRKRRAGRVNQCGHNIIKSAPEIMHNVADDDPEAMLGQRITLQQKKHGTPPGIWIDLRYLGAIRVVLLDAQGSLSLEGLKVFARPCNLCL